MHQLNTADMLETFRRMLRIRRFDEAVAKMAKRGQLPGAVHTSIGQEAQIVGTLMAVRADDYMTGNHRSHGHPIGKGSSLGPLMAEIHGKSTGVCGGKGGSMHLADFAVGSLGESGIVGAGIPIATGAGLTAQVLGTDRVCIAFFGDGAANQGCLHESLNMAAIWNLPVIYLCENNQYASTTKASDVTSIDRIARRAGGYGIEGVTVEDGQDVLEVHRVVTEAVERARRGDGPSLVEVMTYRYSEHSEGLLHAGQYRAEAELEKWRLRDPVVLFRSVLLEREIVSEADLSELGKEIQDEVDQAIQFAKDSPFPEPSALFDDLYSEPEGTVSWQI